jgi:hypothetical protein
MPLNLRRGFFRIWLAVSVLWLFIVGALFYDQIASPYIGPQFYILTDDLDFSKLDEFDTFDRDFQAQHIAMHFPYNVTVYAPNNTPRAALDAGAKVFTEKYMKPLQTELTNARWQSLEQASAFGLLPPLTLLLLGLVIGWISSGFKSTTQKS